MAPAEAAGDPEAARMDQSLSGATVDRADCLERGRQACSRREWLDAYELLALADQTAPLQAGELELLATPAAMLGRDDEYLAILERAHHAYLDTGEALRAARCAFWVGTQLAIRGEMGGAAGWLGRAGRLIEQSECECVERGYLLVPRMMGQEAAGEYAAAYSTALEAAEIGERFGERDLIALALHQQGRVLTKQGSVAEGLVLLDEAMVAVVAGELSPIVTGLIYCSVIEGCQQIYELRRASEWTAALTRWCEEQPDMVSFTGRCLVHRAEIMQLHGAWPEALEEARKAGERFAQSLNHVPAGEATYRQGEIHRLRGDLASAEEAYREASRCGWEPQPGLALLRLAQGENAAAAATIRRIVGETTERPRRAGLLPAHVVIMLAVGDAEGARSACRELEEITESYQSGMLGASVSHARGAVALSDGDAWAALVALRHACQVWQELGAPYECARARVLVAMACRALGDEDTAALELEAARGVFEQLGATPDLAAVDALATVAAVRPLHGLSRRELQVLRLVAAGETNKAIATALVISERTVDRHVSNIFAKLSVASRTAATAYAYENHLV